MQVLYEDNKNEMHNPLKANIMNWYSAGCVFSWNLAVHQNLLSDDCRKRVSLLKVVENEP